MKKRTNVSPPQKKTSILFSFFRISLNKHKEQSLTPIHFTHLWLLLLLLLLLVVLLLLLLFESTKRMLSFLSQNGS